MFHDSLFPSRYGPGIPPHLERYFFALRPPRTIANSIVAWAENLAENCGGDCDVQRADRLHITMAITDDFDHCPAAVVDALLRAGEHVAAAPIAVFLDRLTGSNRSVALRPSHNDEGLKTLYRSLRQTMSAAHIPLRRDWSFSPHMTLAYRQGVPSDRRVEPAAWVAEECVLIRSLVGRTRHETLATWPLRATPPAQFELF